MATASYSYYYVVLSGSPGGNITFNGIQFNNAIGNLTESDANPADGFVALGDTVEWGFLGDFDVVGITQNGDPILQQSGGGPTLYVPSNIAGLENSTLSTTLSGYTLCFAAGTRIKTASGERCVETLSIGDEVQTHEGGTTLVKWLGHQTVSTRFGPAERLRPVRFAAGSLGDGVPHSDLTVTADHAMLVDGVLCNAGALVNGTSITLVPLSEMGETYTVYHVETNAHEIIFANGAPAETFIDNVSRRVFDNFAEFEALYGDVPEMQELPLPRAMSARQVPDRVRTRLAVKRRA